MATETASAARVLAKERIALNAGLALLVAGFLVVIAVLPAEYGVDPLGIGRRLGLTAMADLRKQVDAFQSARAVAPLASTIVPQPRAYQNETVSFHLPPGESIEYKYRLEKGAALLYSWKATGPVNYELHAEPDGAPRGYAESYEKRNAQASASGTLTAPFSGIHGWYWENPSTTDVTVTLSAAGFYHMSHEFRKGAPPKTKMYQE